MTDSTLTTEKEDQAILKSLDEAQGRGEIPPPTAATGLVDNPATAASQTAPAAVEAIKEPVQAVTEKPQGNVNAALRAARHAERQARQEADALRQRLTDLEAGKPAPIDTTLTAEDLEQAQDFPVLQKVIARQMAEQAQRTQQPQTTQPDFVPVQYEPSVQDVIDSIPELVSWQYDPTAQDKFQAAIEADNKLREDPEWRDKPFQERLAEVVARITAPPTPRSDPETVIANAPVQGPKGISDFKGGMEPGQTSIDYARMTDDQIMASLPG